MGEMWRNILRQFPSLNYCWEMAGKRGEYEACMRPVSLGWKMVEK